MATSFRVPDSPDRDVLNIEYFKGVDLYNTPANVSVNRSPEAPNMIRDEVGKVRKRMGFEILHSFPARINGSFALDSVRLVHAGTVLYVEDAEQTENEPMGWSEIYSDMNDKRSRAVQFGDKLYILDGNTFLVYDGDTAQPVTDAAYVPTIIISRSPTGGGTTLEPLNLCSRAWTEQFLGVADVVEYQLTTAELDADTVLCQVLNSSGVWVDKTEGTDFTVNRTTGKVTFSTAPGVSPVTGEDNIKITPSKTRTGYADRINKCDIAALYGVGGSPDRLFVAGNPDHKNMDYYSDYNEPTFFGDTWYSMLGQEDSEIMGYSILNNQLAAHRSGGDDGRNVVIRSGTLDDDGEAVFRINNTLQGPGAVSKYCFQNLGKEPLFLTRLGVYAITAEELTGEKYSQLRSLYLSPAISAEADQNEAVAFVWRDFYLLAVNGTVYVLDGLQKEYQRNSPYSSFQYESYYFTGIDARVFWETDNTLWFGRNDGAVCRFFSDQDDPGSYNDAGTAIDAYWDTPDLSGELFYKNKTFRYMAVRLASAIITGVLIFVRRAGIWSQLYDAGSKARFFSWNYVNFGKFTFSTDTTSKTLGTKIKIKKADKVRFRMKNAEINEPFGIYSMALEYTETSNYKG